MPDNYFEYDQAAAETVKGAMETGEFIKLPFDAVLFHWVRGDASVQPDIGSGVRHFGGWAAGEENMRDYAPSIPERFVPEVFATPDGSKTFTNYCVRSLPVVPIGRRFRWFTTQDNPKGRGHLQYVCYAALYDQENKVYSTWMPVILSAKGLSAMELDNCFKTWKSETAVMRQTHANGAPANFFWSHIGTFGKQRIVKTVGKGATASFITPPTIFVPETLDEAFLRRTFIGKEMTAKVGALAEESREWLEAWKNDEKQPIQAESAPAQADMKAKPPKKVNLEDIPF